MHACTIANANVQRVRMHVIDRDIDIIYKINTNILHVLCLYLNLRDRSSASAIEIDIDFVRQFSSFAFHFNINSIFYILILINIIKISIRTFQNLSYTCTCAIMRDNAANVQTIATQN